MPVPVGGGMAGPSAFDKCKFLPFWKTEEAGEKFVEGQKLTRSIVKMGAMMGGSKIMTILGDCGITHRCLSGWCHHRFYIRYATIVAELAHMC